MDAISVNEILKHQKDGQRLRRDENDAPDAKRAKAEAAVDLDLLAALEEEETDVGPMDEAGVRQLLASFEKRLLKNQEMRIKFPDTPTKFLDSELELHTGIQELHALAAEPTLYPLLWEPTDAVALLLQLLSHENKDIAVAVLSLLQELTDAEAMEAAEAMERVQELATRLLDAQVLALLVQNAERLDEASRDEADGVNNSLSIAENLLELRPEASPSAVSQGLLAWLLKRVRAKGAFDGNKLYASELVAVLLQQCTEAREELGRRDGIDVLLQALAAFKRHNPGSADERELMENLFNSLCAALLHAPNRQKFLDGEGLQLMNLMLREKAESRESALKVLDYATTGPEGAACADKFVEILGLRTLFPLFLKTPPKARRKGASVEEHEEHCVAVVAALLRGASDKSRGRVLAKFVETDHIKVDRLVELYLGYLEKVRELERRRRRDAVEGEAEDAEESYLTRLDGGLFTLQLVCLILADVCVSGAPSIRARAAKLMAMKGGSFEKAKEVLREYCDNMGEGAEAEKKRIQALLVKL